MNTQMIRYLLGITLLIEAGLLIFPLLVALLYGETVYPFLITIGLLVVSALPGIFFKPKNTKIFAKEGFICVGGAWLLMSIFGTVPFVISGAIPNVISAFFETVSFSCSPSFPLQAADKICISCEQRFPDRQRERSFPR